MGYDTPNLDAYINQLSDEVVAEADKWVNKALAADSTTDCVKLANRLSKWMEDQGVGGSNDDEGQGQQGDEQGQEGEGQQAQDGNSDDEGIEEIATSRTLARVRKATLSIQDLRRKVWKPSFNQPQRTSHCLTRISARVSIRAPKCPTIWTCIRKEHASPNRGRKAESLG